MIYREWLVMRKALLWFFGIMLSLAVIGFIATISQPHPRHSSTDMDMIAVPAAIATSIFAAIFGVALGNSSRDGARVFWVLPAARLRLASEVVVVDLLAITAAFVGVYILCQLWFYAMPLAMPFEVRNGFDLMITVQGLLFTYAVYAWSSLVGMIGRRIAYAGIFSLAFLLLWTSFSQLGGWLGNMLRAPIMANPFTVFTTGLAQRAVAQAGKGIGSDPLLNLFSWMTPTNEILVLSAIAITGCVAAIVMWSKTEVLA